LLGQQRGEATFKQIIQIPSIPISNQIVLKKDKPHGIRIQKEIKCETWATLP
jgi:hypothetical protein